jgi:hypothetical protein
VLLRALPGRDQVKHVLALGGLAIILALLACEFHRERLEDGFLEGLKKIIRREQGQSDSQCHVTWKHCWPWQIMLLLQVLSKGKYMYLLVARIKRCSSLLQ